MLTQESPSSNKKIGVFIADDFAMLRKVINMVIEQMTDDMEVVGEAPDLQEALKEAQALQPDVILLNDYFPPTNSVQTTQLFRESGIRAAILIISMNAEADFIQQSLANGANGFMYKDEMGVLLTEAIRTVHDNEPYLSPKAKGVLSGVVNF